MSANTTHLPYRIGEPDGACRYPVIIGEDGVIGRAWRWHRAWEVLTSNGKHRLGRPKTGTKGLHMAAEYLLKEYAARNISAVPLAEVLAEMSLPQGPVPVLDPRMPNNPRNIQGAHTALAKLAEHHWRPLSGFPGSDNPWVLLCELCGWTGPRYWSHLRGRNGNPPRISRHPGCVGEDEVRKLIAAYQV